MLKQGTELIGNRVKVKVAKNKVAPPFKTAEFDIIYGQGISKYGDILDLASEVSIINKSGSWFSYKETRIGQGRENAKQFLQEHEDICLEVENAVREHYGLFSMAETSGQGLDGNLTDGKTLEVQGVFDTAENESGIEELDLE
ncbi:Protein RecA [bioreactor metagenome]|uniref:Protein RecA n=1 Tax=bioreactor metagenome TaxID=1076179 RepID=A0A645F684_9ZZZZ